MRSVVFRSFPARNDGPDVDNQGQGNEANMAEIRPQRCRNRYRRGRRGKRQTHAAQPPHHGRRRHRNNASQQRRRMHRPTGEFRIEDGAVVERS